MKPFSTLLRVTHPFILLPVKNGCEKVVVHLIDQHQIVREFDIELDRTGSPDWWAAYQIDQFEHQTLTIRISNAEFSETELEWLNRAIRLSDYQPAPDNLYQEPVRPQFHFTPRQGWNNDPNGLCYLEGKWHMFFQYNPFGVSWGNMHWGHAVSQDLIHWQELPIALYQNSLKDMAFSGSAFVDWPNHSGKSTPENPALLAAFTSTGRGECLAYSTDQGQTLEELPWNPFLTHYGRDPKIFWYAQASKWVLIVYDESKPHPTREEQWYAIYDSPDLKNWTKRSQLPNLFECPEMFSLPLDGNPEDIRWVVYGSRQDVSRSMCLIGSFDGCDFIPQEENQQAHFGPAFYASQVFNDAPNQRRIMISWLAGAHYPDACFSQGMSVPLELSLRTTSNGIRLCFYPVRELENLRSGSTQSGENLDFATANQLLSQIDAELLDLEMEIVTDGQTILDLRGHPLMIDPLKAQIDFAGVQGRLSTPGSTITLRILIDRSVTEVFANQGEAAFAAMTLPTGSKTIQFSKNGRIKSILIHPLQSIWD